MRAARTKYSISSTKGQHGTWKKTEGHVRYCKVNVFWQCFSLFLDNSSPSAVTSFSTSGSRRPCKKPWQGHWVCAQAESTAVFCSYTLSRWMLEHPQKPNSKGWSQADSDHNCVEAKRPSTRICLTVVKKAVVKKAPHLQWGWRNHPGSTRHSPCPTSAERGGLGCGYMR